MGFVMKIRSEASAVEEQKAFEVLQTQNQAVRRKSLPGSLLQVRDPRKLRGKRMTMPGNSLARNPSLPASSALLGAPPAKENLTVWQTVQKECADAYARSKIALVKTGKAKHSDGLANIFEEKPELEDSKSGMMSMTPSDLSSEENSKLNLSEDSLFAFCAMLQFQIFTGSNLPLLEELCRAAVPINVTAGSLLCKQGEKAPGELFILQKGRAEVQMKSDSNSEGEGVHTAGPGAVLSSLLDLMAYVVMEQDGYHACVSIKMTEDSTVIKIPALSAEMLAKYPMDSPACVSLLQMCHLRLSRLAMLTAALYLGLDEQHKKKGDEKMAQLPKLEIDFETKTADATTTKVVRGLVAKVIGLHDGTASALPELELVDDIDDAKDPNNLLVFQLNSGDLLLDVDPTPSLYVVLSGRLKSTTNHRNEIFAKEGNTQQYLPASAIGVLSMFSDSHNEWYGQDGVWQLTAEEDTVLVRVSRELHSLLLQQHPEMIRVMTQRMLPTLRLPLRQFVFSLKWSALQCAKKLTIQGEPIGDHLHVVVQGRLRATVKDEAGKLKVLGEYGRGHLVGEGELLTHAPAQYTLQATRPCCIASIPGTMMRVLMRQHPVVLAHIAQHAISPPKPLSSNASKTIMLVPVSTSVPIKDFTDLLVLQLERQGHSVTLRSSAVAAAALGTPGTEFDFDAHTHLVQSWLSQQEEQHQILLYQADFKVSTWNRIAAAQADVVLLVANAADRDVIGGVEKQVTAELSKKELVILHIDPPANYMPKGSRNYIESRKEITRLTHVRVHRKDVDYDKTHFKSDFARLARLITGQAVGLTLGGGGARGLAHLALFRVLEELQIPVDVVGGTSIGAFMGGLYAAGPTYFECVHPAYKFARRAGNVWNLLRDVTWPVTSWFSGAGFNHEIITSFGQKLIEDLWISFFCVSVDLVDCDAKVHRNGRMWRYIRASMSLAGFLPPVADQDINSGEVHYLVDGGYMNVLPADIMHKEYGCQTVIAADVSGDWAFKAKEAYGDQLSGWQIVLSGFNPFSTRKVPKLADINHQLAFISCKTRLKSIKKEDITLYLRPPVTGFTTLDFNKYLEIEKVGYDYCKPVLSQWKEDLLAQPTAATTAIFGTATTSFTKTALLSGARASF